jgi:hypothetical protein
MFLWNLEGEQRWIGPDRTQHAKRSTTVTVLSVNYLSGKLLINNSDLESGIRIRYQNDSGT